MARPNVTVIINDESFVISGTESGGAHRSGFPSTSGLLGALGNTTEREEGFMVIPDTNDWFSRLRTVDPTGLPDTAGSLATGVSFDASPFHHSITGDTSLADSTSDPTYFTAGNLFAGATFDRWPIGPTGGWSSEWWSVHNYLLYGGACVVGGTGSIIHTASAADTLKDTSILLDSVFGVSGSNSTITGIVNTRDDLIGVEHIASGTSIASASKSGTNQNMISVFGDKVHVNINNLSTTENANLVTTPLSSDVAGCLARTDRINSPWFSPGGTTRGRILDVVRLAKNLTDSDQDTLYDKNINPVVSFPGEGTILFGDKTNKPSTSTLSRINVARLFLYLRRVIGTSARSLLFEQNDEITRNLFINAVTPFLENIQGQRGITEFKVICDETNNTSSIIDSNQFIADIFIKPTKSINFIRIRFTNMSESSNLS